MMKLLLALLVLVLASSSLCLGRAQKAVHSAQPVVPLSRLPGGLESVVALQKAAAAVPCPVLEHAASTIISDMLQLQQHQPEQKPGKCVPRASWEGLHLRVQHRWAQATDCLSGCVFNGTITDPTTGQHTQIAACLVKDPAASIVAGSHHHLSPALHHHHGQLPEPAKAVARGYRWSLHCAEDPQPWADSAIARQLKLKQQKQQQQQRKLKLKLKQAVDDRGVDQDWPTAGSNTPVASWPVTVSAAIFRGPVTLPGLGGTWRRDHNQVILSNIGCLGDTAVFLRISIPGPVELVVSVNDNPITATGIASFPTGPGAFVVPVTLPGNNAWVSVPLPTVTGTTNYYQINFWYAQSTLPSSGTIEYATSGQHWPLLIQVDNPQGAITNIVNAGYGTPSPLPPFRTASRTWHEADELLAHKIEMTPGAANEPRCPTTPTNIELSRDPNNGGILNVANGGILAKGNVDVAHQATAGTELLATGPQGMSVRGHLNAGGNLFTSGLTDNLVSPGDSGSFYTVAAFSGTATAGDVLFRYPSGSFATAAAVASAPAPSPASVPATFVGTSTASISLDAYGGGKPKRAWSNAVLRPDLVALGWLESDVIGPYFDRKRQTDDGFLFGSSFLPARQGYVQWFKLGAGTSPTVGEPAPFQQWPTIHVNEELADFGILRDMKVVPMDANRFAVFYTVYRPAETNIGLVGKRKQSNNRHNDAAGGIGGGPGSSPGSGPNAGGFPAPDNSNTGPSGPYVHRAFSLGLVSIYDVSNENGGCGNLCNLVWFAADTIRSLSTWEPFHFNAVYDGDGGTATPRFTIVHQAPRNVINVHEVPDLSTDLNVDLPHFWQQNARDNTNNQKQKKPGRKTLLHAKQWMQARQRMAEEKAARQQARMKAALDAARTATQRRQADPSLTVSLKRRMAALMAEAGTENARAAASGKRALGGAASHVTAATIEIRGNKVDLLDQAQTPTSMAQLIYGQGSVARPFGGRNNNKSPKQPFVYGYEVDPIGYAQDLATRDPGASLSLLPMGRRQRKNFYAMSVWNGLLVSDALGQINNARQGTSGYDLPAEGRGDLFTFWSSPARTEFAEEQLELCWWFDADPALYPSSLVKISEDKFVSRLSCYQATEARTIIYMIVWGMNSYGQLWMDDEPKELYSLSITAALGEADLAGAKRRAAPNTIHQAHQHAHKLRSAIHQARHAPRNSFVDASKQEPEQQQQQARQGFGSTDFDTISLGPMAGADKITQFYDPIDNVIYHFDPMHAVATNGKFATYIPGQADSFAEVTTNQFDVGDVSDSLSLTGFVAGCSALFAVERGTTGVPSGQLIHAARNTDFACDVPVAPSIPEPACIWLNDAAMRCLRPGAYTSSFTGQPIGTTWYDDAGAPTPDLRIAAYGLHCISDTTCKLDTNVPDVAGPVNEDITSEVDTLLGFVFSVLSPFPDRPTETPTSAPTASPTAPPTASPTAPPTASPTAAVGA